MKKQILLLFALLIGLTAFSQTPYSYPTLPSGFTPYGTQYYKNSAGVVIVGATGNGFRVITNKATLDSLKNIVWVFADAGQSNMYGSSQDSASAPTAIPGVAQQYYLSQLRPIFKNVGGGNGGMHTSFINELYRSTGTRMIIVPTAKPSTSQTAAANSGNGTWDTTGTLFTNSVTQIQAAMAAASAAGYTPIFKGVLWSQGESDAGALFSGTITKQDYALAFAKMIRRYRTSFGTDMPFYIFRTGGQPGNTGFIPIRAVQDSIANVDQKTYMVFRDAVTFFARALMRPDNLHYLQPGYNQMGIIGAQNVFAPKKTQLYTQYDQIGIGVAEPKSALDIYGDSTISIKGLPKISGGNSGIGFNGAVNTADQVNASATKFAGRIPVWDFNSTQTTNGTEYEDLFTIRHRGTPTAAAVKRSIGINLHISNQSSAGEAAKNGGFELRSLNAFATVPQLYWFVGNKEHGRLGNDGSFSMGLNNNAPFQYFNNYTNDLNYERLGITYASGQFKILADQLGTGLNNELVLGTPNRQLIFNHTGQGTDPYFLRYASGSGANNQRFIGFISPISSTAGINPYVNIRPVINQSGSAGYSALSIYPTENTVGTGAKVLIDAGLATTQRMRLESSGLFNLNGSGGFTFDPSDNSVTLGTVPATETTSDAGIFRRSDGKLTIATIYKKSEITTLLADTASSLYRTKLNSVSLSGLQTRLNAYTPITRLLTAGVGLTGGGNFGADRTISADTTVLATKANSNTLAQLQTRFAAKQNNITLTTTGTSGPATFNQGTGALNIPQYSAPSNTFSNGLTNLSGNVTLGGDIVSPTILTLTGTNNFNLSAGTGVSSSGFFNIGAGSGSLNIIGYATAGSGRSISFSNSQTVVRDDINSKWMEYATDYSVNSTNLNSVPDLRYVNSRGSAYNFTASGNGSSTAIVIPHGLTGISGTSAVVPSAKNSASSGWSYATIDATNVTINYTVAPVSGTNNLSYSIFIKP